MPVTKSGCSLRSSEQKTRGWRNKSTKREPYICIVQGRINIIKLKIICDHSFSFQLRDMFGTDHLNNYRLFYFILFFDLLFILSWWEYQTTFIGIPIKRTNNRKLQWRIGQGIFRNTIINHMHRSTKWVTTWERNKGISNRIHLF